jgi:predicted aconitase
MEALVALGDCFDAESMVPVNSAHILYSLHALGRGGSSYVQDMASGGGRFVVYTDTNPSGVGSCQAGDFNAPEEIIREQEMIASTIVQMGGFLSDTCAPYLVGHVPGLGHHIAWNESSAVAFANSVLGARTNREGGPSAFAAAITGRVPKYGYHLTENRYGEVKVKVQAKLKTPHDYGTLGYHVGKIVGDKVPVFVGIGGHVSWDALKLLSAAIATSGGVGLFHVVGITPEAPSEEAAFGFKNIGDSQTIVFGHSALQETEAFLSDAEKREADLVVFGCPHASITELQKIAQALQGKKLRNGTQMWIVTSRMIKTYAEAMGYVESIEKAGARFVCNTCPVWLFRTHIKGANPTVVATNSAKLVYALGMYRKESRDMRFYYGSVEECVATAAGGR